MVSMPKNLNEFSKEEILNFLDSFDTVLCDCDGVLWLENEVIENSQHTVNGFIQSKNFYFVTNSNSRTREEFAAKCTALGFNGSKESIICTAYLCADYLKSLNFKKKVYVMGTEGIAKELDKVQIQYTGIGPDVMGPNNEAFFQKVKLDPDVGAVLVGFDPHCSYPKMVKAASYLRDPSCLFLATNSDESFPVSSSLSHLKFPGTGCYVRALETVSERKALILGKPNDYIRNVIFKMHKMNPGRTIMIGDKCNTDILFGRRCGFQTLLVLTGVTSLSDVEKFAHSTNIEDHNLVPQFYINKLGDLLPYVVQN